MNKFVLFVLMGSVFFGPLTLAAEDTKGVFIDSDSNVKIKKSDLKGFLTIDTSKDTGDVYHIHVGNIEYVQEHAKKGNTERHVIVKAGDLKIIFNLYKKGITQEQIFKLINSVKK